MNIGDYVEGARSKQENLRVSGIIISLFRRQGTMRVASIQDLDTVVSCKIGIGEVKKNTSRAANDARIHHGYKAR